MFFTARTNNAKAFTLAEAMIATVVLGIAAAGVLMPFMAGASIRAEGQRLTLAAKLGADLMEQIVKDPNIAKWYSDEPQGQIKDAAGNVFTDSGYSQYGRDAVCNKVWVKPEKGYYDPLDPDADEPIFIMATVKVYYQSREIASISRLICK